MLRLQLERGLINYLKDLCLVVALRERPEARKQILRQELLLGEGLEDIVRSLDQLHVRLPRIPQDVEYAILIAPLDQPGSAHGLVAHTYGVLRCPDQ